MTIEDYFAVVGSGYHDKDAAVIGPELEKLAAAGCSSRRDIVAYARPDGSPLHGYFEWDDAAAAERYREEQAGHLVRSVKVTVREDDGTTREMRAFYPVRAADSGEEEQRQYVSIKTVLAERDLVTQVIHDAWRQLSMWRARYRDYDSFFGRVFEVIDATGQTIATEIEAA